jgi:hypothetical protein
MRNIASPCRLIPDSKQPTPHWDQANDRNLQQDPDRQFPAGLQILCLINLSRAALAESSIDPMMCKRSSGHVHESLRAKAA